jgi:hypothetical protein
MKARMRMTGGIELHALLKSNARKVPERARKVMHSASDKIVEEARLNAPVDDAELEDSIHKEVSYTGRGRLVIHVIAGGVVRGVNVDRYAAEIHENYESYTPGPGTVAKRQANPGRYVGSKFLQRAVDDHKEKLLKVMVDAVVKEMKL